MFGGNDRIVAWIPKAMCAGLGSGIISPLQSSRTESEFVTNSWWKQKKWLQKSHDLYAENVMEGIDHAETLVNTGYPASCSHYCVVQL